MVLLQSNKLYISSNGFFSFLRINTLDYKFYGSIPDSSLLFFYNDLYNTGSYYEFTNEFKTLKISFNGNFVSNQNENFSIIIEINYNGIINCFYKTLNIISKKNIIIGYSGSNLYFELGNNKFNGSMDINLVNTLLGKNINFNFSGIDYTDYVPSFDKGFVSRGNVLLTGTINNLNLFLNPINFNIKLGINNLLNNTNGYNNSAIGYQSLQFNTYGYNNNAIGNQALQNNIIGNRLV